MEIFCELENMSATGFTGSLQRLSLALELAVAYGATLPKDIELSDMFTYIDGTIRLSAVPRDGTVEIDTPTVELIDQRIFTTLNDCIERRRDANAANMAVVPMSTDPKHLQLNKAVHIAAAAGVVPTIVGADGQNQRIESVDPRRTTLVEPPAEPVEIEGDYLVSGSNVVGTHQLQLFAETDVDIVFFLHCANFDEFRMRGPLHLASIANMTTRVRGKFKRKRPGDRRLTCDDLPEFYSAAGC